MCKFFSFDTDAKGNYFYFNWQKRQELLKGNPDNYNPDSHTSIATFHGFRSELEDGLNKYEYNPLNKLFTIDKINVNNDAIDAEKWVRQLDFKSIIEPLIIKPIIHPLKITAPAVDMHVINLLINWDSVGASVWDSVRATVGDSVRDSVWATVRDSVWDPVRDSVRAYVLSFFGLKYNCDFSSIVKLWEMGFVPSYDGKIWRLHAGENATIVYEMKGE